MTDAVADFLEFEQEGVSCLLHHSRYAVEDRTWLDNQLLSILGPGGSREGSISVTTQTAEQSLDIDAALLLTDMCPADVLLQRLGNGSTDIGSAPLPRPTLSILMTSDSIWHRTVE